MTVGASLVATSAAAHLDCRAQALAALMRCRCDWAASCLCHYSCCLWDHLCLELSQFTLAGMVLWEREYFFCYGLNCVSLQKMHRSPSPQYLRWWPYLEIGFYRSSQVKMRSLRYAIYKGEIFTQTDIHGGRWCEVVIRWWSQDWSDASISQETLEATRS